jgi:MFS family permease
MSLSSYARLIRSNRNFRLLWLAQIVSEMGDWFYSVAIFSFLLQLTGSAQVVAFAFLMQVFPQVLMSPMAGALNDHLSRKQLMISADLARAVIVICMMLVRTRDHLWLLFLLLALETVCWAVFEPGSRAVIPNVTSPEDVPVANAISAATWSVNFALGAALGGIVDVTFGRNTVFVLDSWSFLASAFLISRMRFPEPHTENKKPLKFRDLFDFSPIDEGFAYVRRDARLIASISIKAGIGLMGANWVIIPILGRSVFPLKIGGLTPDQAGTLGMSALFAARGIGAVVGAFFAGLSGGTDETRLRRSVTLAFLAAAIGYLLVGVSGSLFVALLALVLAHAGGSAGWTASTTLLQQQTEDKFRGRVFSTEFALSMLILSIVSFGAGEMNDRGVDVRTLSIATGALMLAAVVLWLGAQRFWKIPAISSRERGSTSS